MAGLARKSSPSSSQSDPSSPPPSNSSPQSSFSSDKENRDMDGSAPTEKRKQVNQARIQPTPSTNSTNTTNKRRKVSERGLTDPQSQVLHRQRLKGTADTDIYDPEQDPAERRRVRREFRELTSLFNDSRTEYLKPGNNGIRETVERANELYRDVKQTSDATLDSRLLVSAADLYNKRAAQAILGDSTATIDIEEFVSKTISFMRNAPTDGSITSSQHRRRRHTGDAAESDEEEDGDALNWDFLGRQACFPNNSRPAVSGFLLGPLSIKKRTRQITQRRARQERIDPSQLVRPQDLDPAELAKQETSNLTVLCTNIRQILVKTQRTAEALASAELERMSGITQDQALEVMHNHGISDTGGVPLFKFCINPWSFGQSVENMFYVSFLIRDGSIGVEMDSNDLPTLLASEPSLPSEAQRKGIQKHQAVFSLDFETWHQLIEVFDIGESIIPHRNDEEEAAVQGGAVISWHS